MTKEQIRAMKDSSIPAQSSVIVDGFELSLQALLYMDSKDLIKKIIL